MPCRSFRCRIVDLEEELQDLPVVGYRRVVDDLDGLGVGAVVAVGRVGDVTAGVADPGGHHAGLLADEFLHPQKHPPARIAFCVFVMSSPRFALAEWPQSLRLS